MAPAREGTSRASAAFALRDAAFRGKVESALQAARRVLAGGGAPLRYAGDVPHAYADKFCVAAACCGAAVASELAALRAVGLGEEALQQALGWQRAGRAVTLRLDGATRCALKEQRTRVEESPKVTETVTEERSGGFGFGSRTKERTVSVKHEVKEWTWAIAAEWKLQLFTGAAPEDSSGACVLLAGRASEPAEAVTRSEVPPRPKEVAWAAVELDLTWLLRQVEKDLSVRFEIDRAAGDCYTPARNAQVAAAVEHFEAVTKFTKGLTARMVECCALDPAQQRHATGWLPPATSASGIYVAVPAALALAEGGAADAAASEEASPAASGDGHAVVRVVLPASDAGDASETLLMSEPQMATLLTESLRSLDAIYTQLDRKAAESPNPAGPCSAAEVWLQQAAGTFLRAVATSALCAVADVEDMIRRQVVAAVGRELTEKDFSEYMSFHCRNLFGAAYRPRPFCHAIRRPGHAPEGELSICTGGDALPIETMVATRLHDTEGALVPPMHIKLSAAARLAFTGDRYVHGLVRHAFSSSSALQLHLRARARQFSSFVLVAGTITAADELTPKAALLVRDKDELDIPLMLETIPTQKEFRDAIESLSPEQQDFCKALRSMQLASTLFGIAIIQVKPQMERLLNLPPDALTKEIKLTRDLLSLFCNYQMPSDLLSFGGDAEAGVKEKIAVVAEQVAAMNEMIAEEKKAEAEEAVLQRRFETGGGGGGGLFGARADDMVEGFCEKLADSSQSFGSARVRRMKGMPKATAVFGAAPPAPQMRARGAPLAMAPPMPHAAQQQQVMPSAMPQAHGFADQVEEAPAPGAEVTSDAEPPQQQPAPAAQAGGAGGTVDVHSDVTTLPSRLDAACAGSEARAGALRATVIKPADAWSKTSQPKLLGAKKTTSLRIGSDEEKGARAEAMDLLDALSRSGELLVECAELHVVLAATHCFDSTLIDTVVAENINPIAKVERSCVSIASVVHGGIDPAAMLPQAAAERLGFIESSA